MIDDKLNRVYIIRADKAQDFLKELETPHASKEFVQECIEASRSIKRRNRKYKDDVTIIKK
jgi:hypothetical protein